MIRRYDIYERCGEGVEAHFTGFKSRDKPTTDKRVPKPIKAGKTGRKPDPRAVTSGITSGPESQPIQTEIPTGSQLEPIQAEISTKS